MPKQKAIITENSPFSAPSKGYMTFNDNTKRQFNHKQNEQKKRKLSLLFKWMFLYNTAAYALIKHA